MCVRMRGNAISIYTGSVRDNACKLSKNHCIKSEYMYVKIDGWCKQLVQTHSDKPSISTV